MNREEIIAQLKKDKPYLAEKFGIEELALFGSYARNEQTDESDIDVLISLKEPKLTYLVGVLDFLEKQFQKKIDITTKHKYLSDRFWGIIKDDIIYV
jgi:predicted nucleotidyltransferase